MAMDEHPANTKRSFGIALRQSPGEPVDNSLESTGAVGNVGLSTPEHADSGACLAGGPTGGAFTFVRSPVRRLNWSSSTADKRL